MSEEVQKSEPEAFTESPDSPQGTGGGSVNASGVHPRDLPEAERRARMSELAKRGAAKRAANREAEGERVEVTQPGVVDASGGLEESDFASVGIEILRKLATDPKAPPQTRAYCAKALADKRSADVPLPRSVREVERMSNADLYAAIAALEGKVSG